MNRTEANTVIFNPNDYHITNTGGLYRKGGKKLGAWAFDFGTLELTQINIYASLANTDTGKELQTLCLLHSIKFKTIL